MSNKNFTITRMSNSNVEFVHANGNSYRGSIGNCGEAMYIYDADGKEISTIPTNEYSSLSETDVVLASNVISAIERNKAEAAAAQAATEVIGNAKLSSKIAVAQEEA